MLISDLTTRLRLNSFFLVSRLFNDVETNSRWMLMYCNIEIIFRLNKQYVTQGKTIHSGENEGHCRSQAPQ